MKNDNIKMLQKASLFPVLSETNKERKITSIFLCLLSECPDLAKEVLAAVGVRIGVRSDVQAFTEVPFGTNRPDGLILVSSPGKEWSAIVETKVGKNKIDADQVQRYIDVAKSNKINSVITISNEFVAKSEHSPVYIPNGKIRPVKLFHLSWSRISTICKLLYFSDRIENETHKNILGQFNEFLNHPTAGVERFTQMAPAWKDVVQTVLNEEELKRNSPQVVDVVESWLSEEKDLLLHLSEHVGVELKMKDERRLESREARVKDRVVSLIDTSKLTTSLRVPDCAADILVRADLSRRTVSVSMSLEAPRDRKSNKARVNWLLRMLPFDDPRIRIQGYKFGSRQPVGMALSELRSDAGGFDSNKKNDVVQKFEVIMIENLGKRFSGQKTFIESMEKMVFDFYDLVAVNLKAWQASPPMPVVNEDASDKE